MSASEILYKVLDDDGACHHGGQGRWHLPPADAPGEWMPAIHGALDPCRRGYHLCRETELINWLGPAIFVAEYDGDRVEVNDANEGKVVVRRARLLSRVSNWDAQSARLFACDCAERALLRERERGREPDPRSWESITVARRLVRGEATQVELTAARTAAGTAAGDAARTAAGDAARTAAWTAAWAAAGDAAWAAAGTAAWAAARTAAWAAAGTAARTAAWDAARTAAWDAARTAEREWQTDRLSWYLVGQPSEVQP